MSERTKQFGSGAIVSAMLIFTLTGVFGWIGVTTAEVPALKAQAQAEFMHLNKSIGELTMTAKETNKQLQAYTEFHAVNLSRLTEAIVGHGYEIRTLKKNCDENSLDIKKCKVLMNRSNHNGT